MRKKTRGGRDQNRWRRSKRNRLLNNQKRNKSGHRMKAFYFVFRKNNPLAYVRVPESDCFKKAMSGTLTLVNNPDCDFVKGGE